MPGENRCAATCSKCHWNHTRKPPISWSSMDIMPQLGISSSFVIELPRAEMNTHYSHRRIFGAPNHQLWLQQLPLVKLQLGQNTLMSSWVHSEVHSDSCVVPSTTSSSMQHLTHMLPCLALAMHSHGGFLKWGYPQFSSILIGFLWNKLSSSACCPTLHVSQNIHPAAAPPTPDLAAAIPPAAAWKLKAAQNWPFDSFCWCSNGYNALTHSSTVNGSESVI